MGPRLVPGSLRDVGLGGHELGTQLWNPTLALPGTALSPWAGHLGLPVREDRSPLFHCFCED